ncbi:hypothetical protein ABZ078_12480 [Streptomyces sp. NPDC006385]|uniref:DUF6907 domain-containing protein n=1 Tax=Streptomyces sp. NPDC006385 TaxID=3156761 RepID=UPI0033A5EFD4
MSIENIEPINDTTSTPGTARLRVAPVTETRERETGHGSQLAALSVVTALVNGVQVPIACPTSWCVEDHAGENTTHLEDVVHSGEHVDLYAHPFNSGDDVLFAYARLGQDLFSVDPKERAPYVCVEDGSGEERFFTPDQADVFAENLDVFGRRIRDLAQVARSSRGGTPAQRPTAEPDMPSFAKVIGALPAAVAESMEKTLPEQYTPEYAATLATTMIAELIQGRRVAAAKRSLTPAQQTLTPDDGLGGWMTAPVETAHRDIDDNALPAENEQIPFLAAKAVVLGYRSQAYGRRTQVCLDYGGSCGSLTPPQAREVLAAMRAFTDQFEAVIEIAAESAAGDFEGDPEIAAADEEAEKRRTRRISEGHGKGVTPPKVA